MPDQSEIGQTDSGCADTDDRCREALMHIYTYLDGEVTQDLKVVVSRHLADCSPCEGAFGFEAELKSLVSRCCTEQVPEGLKQRIADALGLV